MNGGAMYPVYIVQERAREGSSWRGIGTGAAVGAAGVLLYFLLKNLGFGGRDGASGNGHVPLPLAPPRPKDAQRLSFVMTQPTALGHPMSFRPRGGLDTKGVYSLEELISRVKAGGRTDVELLATGDVIQGPWDSALDLIKRAGLTVWKGASSGSAAQVSGNDRGQYGARSWSIS